MNIKGIVFDKDGTLLDFDSFWVPVAREATRRILAHYNAPSELEEPILRAIGVRDGRTHVDGMLCKGSYEDIYYLYLEELSARGLAFHGEEFIRLVVSSYHDALSFGRLEPVCEGLKQTLDELKARGLVLGVVTSDDPKGTELCLKGLGIEGCFDLVLTSDRVHPSKPDPYYMYEFCKRFSLRPEEVMMVGDTLADMKFGKNSGAFAVGVAKLRENREFISPYADRVIHDVSALPELLSEKQGE